MPKLMDEEHVRDDLSSACVLERIVYDVSPDITVDGELVSNWDKQAKKTYKFSK